MRKYKVLVSGIFWTITTLFLCWFILFEHIAPTTYGIITIARQEVALVLSLGVGTITMYLMSSRRPEKINLREHISKWARENIFKFEINPYERYQQLWKGDSRIFFILCGAFVLYNIVMRQAYKALWVREIIDLVRGTRYGGSTIIGILGFFVSVAYMYSQFGKYEHDSIWKYMMEFPLAVCGTFLLVHYYNVITIPSIIMLYEDFWIIRQVGYATNFVLWQVVTAGTLMFYKFKERIYVKRFLWIMTITIAYSLLMSMHWGSTNTKAHLLSYVFCYIPFWAFIFIPSVVLLIRKPPRYVLRRKK